MPFTLKLNTHLSPGVGGRGRLKEDEAGAAVDTSPAAVPCQPDEPVDKRQHSRSVTAPH